MTLAEQFVDETKNINDQYFCDHFDDFKYFQEAKIVDEKEVRRSRWYERIRYCLIFTDGSLAAYEQNWGLTENQDDTPEEISAYLIEPYTETITKYRKVSSG